MRSDHARKLPRILSNREKKEGDMTRWGICVLGLAMLALAPRAEAKKCPKDSVEVGTICVDKYEASVWQIDPANKPLVRKAQAGNATLADLMAGGATQLSRSPSCSPAYPANFPASGQWTPVVGSNPPSPGI